MEVERLSSYVIAQEKFKTALGRRRYGTLKELADADLLNETVIKFDASGKQVRLGGWYIEASERDPAFLKNNFAAVLLDEENNSRYCVFTDGLVRVNTDYKGKKQCTKKAQPIR